MGPWAYEYARNEWRNAVVLGADANTYGPRSLRARFALLAAYEAHGTGGGNHAMDHSVELMGEAR